MHRVLLTGAEGVVGTVLRQGLDADVDLLPLTRRAAAFPSVVADIADLEALTSACAGVDAVIHLAAAAWLDAPWDDVLESNIVGTRNVFEAARLAGVRAVVFASSGHVVGAAEDDDAELYDLDDGRTLDESSSVRPDSLYAVSKVFGEALGRFYADTYGMRVICLRLGTVLANDDPCSTESGRGRSGDLAAEQRFARIRAKWLSHRDCCTLLRCALAAEHLSWAVVFGTSDNPRQIWNMDGARQLLGYQPQDSAPVECG